MGSVIVEIMKKELIQTVRDPRMVAVILVAPLVQTIVFGFAVNLDLQEQPLVIADEDHTQASREMAAALANNAGFDVVGYSDTHAGAEEAVLDGDAALALLVPRGFERAVANNEGELFLVLDGSDSNTALRAGQEATQILADQALRRQRLRLDRAFAARGVAIDGLLPAVEVVSRAWFNPQMKTAIFLVPAVFALVLMLITMVLTSMGLTREKEIGTLEQIMVTPIRPIELMVGKTLPFAALGLIDVTFIVSIAAIVFDVPVRGSLGTLYAASGLFLMTTLGLGLFISTISATQQQAMLTAFFVVLPALMLSGYVYPIENMPEAVQHLTLVNPLRYYIELTRGVLVKGASLFDLWPSAVMLAVLGAAVLWGASLRFRKRIG
jgi:ABC-2 type transport system permease protein